MFSAFRGIWLVAEQRSRGALRDAGLHFAAALRLSGRGKSPGLRPFGGIAALFPRPVAWAG